MQQLQIIASIVAVTELIKQVFPGKIGGPLTIVVAALLGTLAGFAHIEGLTWVSGLISALAAVGIHTVGSKIGS